MVSSSKMTDFQRVIKDIENYEFTEDEQLFVDKYFGPPLTEEQKYEMHLRHHLHLKLEEKGEGFKKTKPNKGNTSKSLLPKSLMKLFDESTDLKTKWKLFCKTLWWTKYVRHIEVDPAIWDVGERLLAEYPNGRKSISINVPESIKHRVIIEY